MMSQSLAVETDVRGVTTITLARPERANAIDHQLLLSLFATLRDAATCARVVVLRGSGKHFCSGADVTDLGDHAASQETIPQLCEFLDKLPKPTICVVHGACIGAGLAIAACCDAVIATPGARFSIPEVRLGISPGPLMPFMIRACGERFLRRHLLSGAAFNGDEAKRVGLVHEICEQSSLDDTLASLADEYLRAAPGAVQSAKLLLSSLSRDDSQHSLRDLEEMFKRASRTAEAAEGIASFKENRPPTWYGG